MKVKHTLLSSELFVRCVYSISTIAFLVLLFSGCKSFNAIEDFYVFKTDESCAYISFESEHENKICKLELMGSPHFIAENFGFSDNYTVMVSDGFRVGYLMPFESRYDYKRIESASHDNAKIYGQLFEGRLIGIYLNPEDVAIARTHPQRQLISTLVRLFISILIFSLGPLIYFKRKLIRKL